MRRFSDFEKKLLSALNTTDRFMQPKKIMTLLEPLAKEFKGILEVDFNIMRVVLKTDLHRNTKGEYFENPNYGLIQAFEQGIKLNERLFTMISLLKYLEKNDLINFYNHSVNKQSGNVFKFNNKYKFEFDIMPSWVSSDSEAYILENFQKTIFLSEELIQIINNDFKTAEQKRHEESINMAVALGYSSLAVAVISVLLAVISIFVSLII